ncbi:MAG: hypothetical protein FWD88_06890, partial [Treponema sp.]|nr:hypothetical protein [Treponema sp.]
MDLRSMGTANLGAMHLDNFRLGGSITNSERSSGGSLSSFEEMLRNSTSRSTPEGNAQADPPASSTPVVAPTAPLLNRHTPPGVTIDRDSDLFQQCLELETFLVQKLVRSMRSTIQRSDLIEQSFAGEMYEDMLFD